MIRYLPVFLSIFMISACDHYSQKLSAMGLNAISPAAGEAVPFETYLSWQYFALARFENDEMMDYPAARYFTDKAVKAEQGKMVAPGGFKDFTIKPQFTAELVAARAELIEALKTKMVPINHAALARAQAKYDCWLEQQEENHQSGDIAACKYDFWESMDAVVEPIPEDQHITVYFDHNSTEIDLMAWAEIQGAVDFIKKYPHYQIVLSGHADSSGSPAYNEKISTARVQAVAGEFYQSLRGVKVYQTAKGEGSLPVKTADNVKEAQNRRVDILLKRPSDEVM